MEENQRPKRERPGEGELPTVHAKQSPKNSLPDVAPGLAKYFQKTSQLLNHMQYGDPSDFIRTKFEINLLPSPLDSIWIPPRFKHQDIAGEDISLDHLLHDPSRCILVLADPGCGKSTLARFLTLAFTKHYIEGKQDYFGLLVPFNGLLLSGLSNQEAIFLSATKLVGLENDKQVLDSLMTNISKCCVIFDGLDELPVSRRASSEAKQIPIRAEAAELVRTLFTFPFAQSENDTPKLLIVTCRSKDYFEDREQNGTSYLGAVPQYFISKFSPDQMVSAVEKWHKAAANLVKDTSITIDNKTLSGYFDERQHEIRSVLRDNSDLATVCLTPIMLSVLLGVYSDAQDLPSSVSQLCWRAVKWFLVEKHVSNPARPIDANHSEWLLQTVVDLGFFAHTEIEASGKRSFDTNLIRKVARGAREKITTSRLDYGAMEDAITGIVLAILEQQSIIVQSSPQEFDFSHNVFRDVLAGRALQAKSLQERCKYVSSEHWQGPIRYWAGTRARETGGLYEISAFVTELVSDTEAATDLPTVLVCAEMLAEVRMTIPKQELTKALNMQILDIIQRLQMSLEQTDMRLSQRIRIGDLLGILGDPILESGPLKRMVKIEGGVRNIGRTNNHKSRIQKYQSCPASPNITGNLDTFNIASYLVTNAEYAKFVDDKGYSQSHFWKSSIGWKWASGEPSTIESLLNNARQVAGIHFSSELVGQRLTADEIPERVALMIQRHIPMYWLDPAHNRPNQPVVGINWWEASAYCAWLEERLKREGELEEDLSIRLPIEAEWETAARLCGNDGVYPWIDGTPGENSHVREAVLTSKDSPIFRSCAIGLFRSVKTKLPLYDMVGNVWEWIGSKSGKYSSNNFKRRIDYQGLEDRIARGSSWLSQEEESTQVTFRSFDPPFQAYEDLGFRIVVSKSSHS